MGISMRDAFNISFLGAPPGRFQKALITLTSQSVAALNLSDICLMEADGQCAENNTTGGFRICRGNPVDPDGCGAVTLPEGPLNFEDEFIFRHFMHRLTMLSDAFLGKFG